MDSNLFKTKSIEQLVSDIEHGGRVMVAVKLAAVLCFLAAGATYVKPENWSPFAPFGWSGIMSAAAVVFCRRLAGDGHRVAWPTSRDEGSLLEKSTLCLAS
jgi:basic amino acid/polyamine antiporter, APA family